MPGPITVEPDEAAPVRAGFRLARLEVYNWGTFHRRAWRLDLAGDNAFLTGDIGSGKSTLVDAVTTLLLPANRISYNKAAGAEVRERSLRSYVDGYFKSERSETTGTSRPVGLRGPESFSAIVGVFRNDGYDLDVSLAQVFWTKDGVGGQPERFFAVADRQLGIEADLADFGSGIAALRKRLRSSGARVYDHFPEYGKDFRRRLGIESEQAMELLHQTVSMKSVGDLNEFVRSHMLEPFDARGWVGKLVAHFDDLTRAHDAVVKARAQLDELSPLLAECDTYDTLGGEIAPWRPSGPRCRSSSPTARPPCGGSASSGSTATWRPGSASSKTRTLSWPAFPSGGRTSCWSGPATVVTGSPSWSGRSARRRRSATSGGSGRTG